VGDHKSDIDEYDLNRADREARLENLKNEKSKLEEKINSLSENIDNSEKVQIQKDLLEDLDNSRERRIELEKKIEKLENKISNRNLEDDYRDRIGSIQRDLDEVKKIVNSENLDNKKEKLDNLIAENQDLRKESEKLKQKLAQTVSMGIGGSLGEAFNNRRDEIESSVAKWRFWTGFSIGLLIIASVAVYADLVFSGASSLNFISKIALILPVSVAVWFASSNYNRERRLMEEYAFKSTLSFSLDGYRKVLQEELPEDNKDQLGEFLTEAMLGIYENPYANMQSEQNQVEKSSLNTTNEQLIRLLRKVSPNK